MSQFRKGDRVKVEFEGVVQSASAHQANLACWDVEVEVAAPGRPNDSLTVYVRHEHMRAIEPEYEQGVVYEDAEGDLFYRLSRSNAPLAWRSVRTGVVRRHDFPTRPLRKLAPEGGK